MIASLEILGLRVAVSGPPSLVEDFLGEYPHARRGNGGAGFADVVLEWEGLTCRVEPWGMSYPVESFDLLPPVTRVLLRRALAQANPTCVFLHGNAVVREGRLLFFVGQSGLGKTTLSLKALGRFGESAAMLADDLLVIDLKTGMVHPYPRSSRILERGRSVYHLSPRQHSFPVPLAGADGVFLHLDNPVGAETTCQSMILSAWTGAAEEVFEGSSATSYVVARHGGAPVVTPSSRLREAEVARIVDDLARRGVLALAVGVPRQPRAITRPALPRVRPLPWSQALDCVLSNLAGSAPLKGGELAMALSRAFSEMSCWLLTPGGTPEQSLDALLQEARRAA